jgi:hypothetical protein
VAQNKAIERPAATAQPLALPFKVIARKAANSAIRGRCTPREILDIAFSSSRSSNKIAISNARDFFDKTRMGQYSLAEPAPKSNKSFN